MASAMVVTGPSYQVRGAIRYLRDEQQFPTMGMALVTRFGGHNTALLLALQKRTDSRITDSSDGAFGKTGRPSELRLNSGEPPYQGRAHTGHRNVFARMACELYDSSGQFSRIPSTGSQLDLVG
ncbi:MAG: hypothetical protein JW759_02260 [Candidatus Coatesbacteria bacterium]|nr:hypothetical protein [Candidatus Coatesbacteria bacterium]